MTINAQRLRKWRAANPDKVKASQDRWLENNHELQLACVRAWRKKNPDKCKEYKLRWRARAAGTRVESRIIKKKISNWESKICGICLKQISGDYHLDHIIPLSRGGPHTTENLQLAHPLCNQSKFTRLQTEVVVILS